LKTAGRLSTHVLDTMRGIPARGVAVELSLRREGRWEPLKQGSTNADGRVDPPLLEGDAVAAGEYRLVFAVGDYFRGAGVVLPQPAFLERIAIEFGIADPLAHYHVPLLCTPWSYSTYRGS
jgi:5-hydroxyisourate hydrolase